MENNTFAWTAIAVEEFPNEVATACVEGMELWVTLNYQVQKFTNKYHCCHGLSLRA